MTTSPPPRSPDSEGKPFAATSFAGGDDALDALVSKYDRAGPRYTSYPTAVQFSESFGARDYQGCLSKAARQVGSPLAVYVHVPFCEKRCTYCACHVVPTPKRTVAETYLDHVKEEIALVSTFMEGTRPIEVLHLGGGTPTYLAADQFDELVGCLFDHFPVAKEHEFSIEVDPRVTSREQLERLGALGFTRASVGIQDFSPRVQEYIGREQTIAQTEETFQHLRRLGFHVNFDFVYGLPGQTERTMDDTLSRVLRMRPDRIAFYGYAHVPWMHRHQRKIDSSLLAVGVAKLRLFMQSCEVLIGGGYRQIGMDHFALDDDALTVAMDRRSLGRNFMGYTPHAPLEILGLGPSAIGSLSGAYIQNSTKLADYFKATENQDLPVHRGVFCDRDDDMRRWVIHQILCQLAVEFDRFQTLSGVAFWDYYPAERDALREFETDGLVKITETELQVTSLGRWFLRNVAMIFDRYLREARVPAGGRFSRTV